SNRLRSAIVWGFVGWVVLSAYWRFLLPLTTGTDVQDLFAGLLGANPGTLALAKKAWASVEEIFVAWIAAAGLFFVLHLLIAIDYRRASDMEWVKGVPAYAWLLGTGLSYVNGPSSDPEERTVDQVINGVTKNESPRERPKTLPEKNGPENGAFTVAPAPTVRGTLIVIVVSSRPSGVSPGVSGASDWIRTEATVRRMSVDA